MQRAVETLDHFPSLAQIEELGADLKEAHHWKHIEVDDCMTCGGVGWHFIELPNGAHPVVACDDCRAGKNMQSAPKGHITWTLRQVQRKVPDAKFAGPGRGR